VTSRVVHPRLRALLEGEGVSWSVEPSKRHFRLVVEGRTLAVLPRGRTRDAGCAIDNTLATVRRAIKNNLGKSG
jgi:hypothetical protein